MTNNEYQITNLNSTLKINGIFTIHYFRYGKNFDFKTESHNFWELVFIDSGNAQILNDKTTLSLKQGQAFLHAPNVPHTIFTNDDFANSAIISFKCNNKILKTISGKILVLNDYEKSLLNKIISEGKSNFTDKLNDVHLLKMTKSQTQPFGGEQVIRNCIELLFISLIRNTEYSGNSIEIMNLNNNSSNQITLNIIKILTEKLEQGKNINLDEISFKLGFSKSYIKTQFKKSTGISIIQYYINMKIDKAKKLLSQHKFTISEISDILGFASIHYFSRQFKAQTDMSPSEYIHSIKADNVL